MINSHVFRQHLLTCFSGNVPGKLLVALSGGVDSMCLTHLLLQYKKLYDPKLEIHTMTIDHGYRKMSSLEAHEVGRIVQSWGAHHYIHRLSYDRNPSTITNFEEVARTMRYNAFERQCDELGIRALLLAHNLNDRIETFLQRLQMNSTLYGLGGLKPRATMPISSKSPQRISVFRPLLQFDKQSLRETCVKSDVLWFEDHTNADLHLTKRNLFRYMVNEYVPQEILRRPDLAVLSKESLLKTLNEVDEFLTVLDDRIKALDDYVMKQGSYEFNKGLATIKFSVPVHMWLSLDPSVAARWLYEKVSPISSAKHLHWSYAKIERQAMPRIRKYAKAARGKLNLTYLNVVFQIESDEGLLHFSMSKQPPTRKDLACIRRTVSVPSPWMLIDRTWWVEIKKASSSKVTIEPYNSKMKKQLLEAFPQVTPSKILNLPIIKDENTVVGIPTLGLSRNGLQYNIKYRSEHN